MGDLTVNFDRSEFECKCGCGTNNVSMDLVYRLQRLRNMYRKPIYINSGCRCAKHNAKEGGAPNSAHLASDIEACEAADIRIHSGGELDALLSLIYFYSLFPRKGVGATFLHVDIDKNKPSPWIWKYPSK